MNATAEQGPSPSRPHLELGLAPVLAPLAALGLLLVALGNNTARSAGGLAEPLFWAGLFVIYAPIVWRLVSADAGRGERIALVILLSVSLFLVKVLYSPNEFVFYDELGWWRATHDLLTTGRPVSSNPLVITTPVFPGLDLLTGPVDQLARLSIFDAGTIVVGVARTAFMYALFLFFERATRSTRAAGIGVAVYAANPSFLYFNAQFAYESVALLIGVVLLLVAIRWSEGHDVDANRGTRSLIAAMAILAATLTITHHMTSYAILVLLIAWAVLTEIGEPTVGASWRESLRSPALPAIVLGVMASLWFAFVAGGLTLTEAGDQLTGSIRAAFNLVFGGSGPKKPFEAGGQTNSSLARAAAIVSVLSLLAVLPLGLRQLRRRVPRDPLQWALALLAVLYLVALGLRLTSRGTETSQRASEFVFLGLGFLAAVVIANWRWPIAGASRRFALAALATVVFAGGFIIGEPPQGRQPGHFLVAAERRSISAEGIAAAEFAGRELKPGSRILVDHANATLMGSYGGLNPITKRVDGISISRVFFDKKFDRPARRIVLDGHIRYIVVDRRLHRTIPVQGSYFGIEEPLSFERKNPISLEALTKFRDVKGLTKVYDNGPISIYDTFGLRPR